MLGSRNPSCGHLRPDSAFRKHVHVNRLLHGVVSFHRPHQGEAGQRRSLHLQMGKLRLGDQSTLPTAEQVCSQSCPVSPTGLGVQECPAPSSAGLAFPRGGRGPNSLLSLPPPGLGRGRLPLPSVGCRGIFPLDAAWAARARWPPRPGPGPHVAPADPSPCKFVVSSAT